MSQGVNQVYVQYPPSNPHFYPSPPAHVTVHNSHDHISYPVGYSQQHQYPQQPPYFVPQSQAYPAHVHDPVPQYPKGYHSTPVTSELPKSQPAGVVPKAKKKKRDKKSNKSCCCDCDCDCTKCFKDRCDCDCDCTKCCDCFKDCCDCVCDCTKCCDCFNDCCDDCCDD